MSMMDSLDDDGLEDERLGRRVSPKGDADRGCDVVVRLPLPGAAGAVPEPRPIAFPRGGTPLRVGS